MLLQSQTKIQPHLISMQEVSDQGDKGVVISTSIFGAWAITLSVLLRIDISALPIAARVALVALQTFLYTGLFINAHDAMHGAIAPKNPKLNRLIGSISIFCYALFSYKNLLKSHWLHHQHPASESDPDFHNGRFKNPVAWFLQFMFNYWSWTRLIGLVLVFHTLRGLFHIPVANLNWFWITPAIASSMQLFFFGTYLPHREPKGGYQNSSRAQSTNWSTFWSFISCYHFGYHLEHHEYPNAPWWALPQVHQQRKSKDFQGAL